MVRFWRHGVLELRPPGLRVSSSIAYLLLLCKAPGHGGAQGRGAAARRAQSARMIGHSGDAKLEIE